MENPFKEILGEDRPLRIFNVPWHIAHQYELYKIPFTQWGHQVNKIRKWGKYRPFPDNVQNVSHYEEGKWDIAVLHIDQQCVDQNIGKSRLFRELNEQIKDIPKIVIQHGTPFWEQYTPEFMKMQMKMLLKNAHVVFNSHRAEEMWGQLGKSQRTIIHGMSPDEWLDLPKEPRIVTMLSPAGLDAYYNRQLLSTVKNILKGRGVPHCHITVDWVAEDFDDYREFLGRSLIYFNPTKESPMPRSRTEAMFSGCCVVTTPHHGADKFIEHGVNGILVDDQNPIQIADLLQNLLEQNYQKCIEIGQRGKETAMKEFHIDRFTSDWTDLLKEALKV